MTFLNYKANPEVEQVPFFLGEKNSNFINKDRPNQPKLQKKAVVEHPPSTLENPKYC